MSARVQPGADGLDDEAVEALLCGDRTPDPELGGALAAFGRAVLGDVPEPSPELAALLRAGVPAAAAPPRRVVQGFVVAAAAGATLAVSGAAAAADVLPGPVERVVTDIVNNATPFRIAPQETSRPVGQQRTPVPARLKHARPAAKPTMVTDTSATAQPGTAHATGGAHRGGAHRADGDRMGGATPRHAHRGVVLAAPNDGERGGLPGRAYEGRHRSVAGDVHVNSPRGGSPVHVRGIDPRRGDGAGDSGPRGVVQGGARGGDSRGGVFPGGGSPGVGSPGVGSPAGGSPGGGQWQEPGGQVADA